MRPFLFAVPLFLLAGCPTAAKEETTCQKLCRDLITLCDYAAYPSTESCENGCEYDAENGADTTGMYTCVLESIEGEDCDTFAIVECEHEYGPDAED